MQEASGKPKLKGTVEVDETFIGGHYDRGRHRGPWEKQAVVGLLQRNGHFEAKPIRTPSKKVLCGAVRNLLDKGSTIMADEIAAYKAPGKDFKHETVNHGKEEWVHGNIHTNGIENAWSLFKRSIVGAFHHVSEKHLSAYLEEFEWRFNRRENECLFRDTLIKLLNAPKMEFKELIANNI